MQENIVILGTGFIAGYLNRGLHYLFSELRQPMVGNVCAIGKHPEKLASRTNILKDCVLCTDPIDSVLFKFHPTYPCPLFPYFQEAVPSLDNKESLRLVLALDSA